MRRTQIQLDDEIYRAVRDRAFRSRRSMSGVIRETLAGALLVDRSPRPSITHFSFVSSGRSKQPRGRAVSEHHDAALAEAFAQPRNSRR